MSGGQTGDPGLQRPTSRHASMMTVITASLPQLQDPAAVPAILPLVGCQAQGRSTAGVPLVLRSQFSSTVPLGRSLGIGWIVGVAAEFCPRLSPPPRPTSASTSVPPDRSDFHALMTSPLRVSCRLPNSAISRVLSAGATAPPTGSSLPQRRAATATPGVPCSWRAPYTLHPTPSHLIIPCYQLVSPQTSPPHHHAVRQGLRPAALHQDGKEGDPSCPAHPQNSHLGRSRSCSLPSYKSSRSNAVRRHAEATRSGCRAEPRLQRLPHRHKVLSS